MNRKELLRFTTAGSVDDGKSTLIGRLLYDSKSIFQDQLDLIKRTSNKKGHDYLDLSLLTDGLKSEREQGITIDVAYRYFETPKRKFIIADTPGHIQYTRNMVTGASTANLALILIDARKGILEQTHRHSFIASILGIPHAIVCVNKMDLINYDENKFLEIVEEFKIFSKRLNIKDIRFIPISALKGDNIVNKTQNMNWYEGNTLLYELENIHIGSDLNHVDSRMSVQGVIRPHTEDFQDYRGYTGRISSGVFKVNDEVMALPSGFTTTIHTIHIGEQKIDTAYAPMSITLTLTDDIDISQGDMLVKPNNIPKISQEIDILVCWMYDKPLRPNTKLIVKHCGQETKALVIDITYEIDINTLRKISSVEELILNAIGRVKVKTSKPLFIDRYEQNKETGSLIFIDPITNNTVGAGIIR